MKMASLFVAETEIRYRATAVFLRYSIFWRERF